MRALIAVVAGFTFACASGATLELTPSGTQTIRGPTEVVAGADATWSLTGPGSLTSTFGRRTTYVPPAAVSTASPPTAVVTATANGASASVTFTPPPPPLPPGVIPGLSGAVQVVFDAEQIPHIFCKARNDCFAVQG